MNDNPNHETRVQKKTWQYSVRLNGVRFSRTSRRTYESAGAYQHKESGAFGKISFAGPGQTPNPRKPSYKADPDWVLVIAKVQVDNK